MSGYNICRLPLKCVNFRSPFNPDIFIEISLCNMNITFIFHFSWVVTVTFFRYLATMFKNILWECNKPPPPIKVTTTLCVSLTNKVTCILRWVALFDIFFISCTPNFLPSRSTNFKAWGRKQLRLLIFLGNDIITYHNMNIQTPNT